MSTQTENTHESLMFSRVYGLMLHIKWGWNGRDGRGGYIMVRGVTIPCSPVQVPPMAIARSAILPASRFASDTSLGYD